MDKVAQTIEAALLLPINLLTLAYRDFDSARVFISFLALNFLFSKSKAEKIDLVLI